MLHRLHRKHFKNALPFLMTYLMHCSSRAAPWVISFSNIKAQFRMAPISLPNQLILQQATP